MSMEWAKREVEIACKREAPDRKDGEWDYGCACYESALKAYESLINDDHSGMSWSLTKNILIRLMEGKPLTPIEDTPDAWNDVTCEGDDGKQYQCRRMSSLFKNVDKDGKVTYSDVRRYYCKDMGTGSTYTCGLESGILNGMFPVTMPYNPATKPYVIRTGEYLTDRKNGDFDTKAVYCIVTPDGDRITVDRFFAEDGINGWREIDREEYQKRVEMHNEREQREVPE